MTPIIKLHLRYPVIRGVVPIFYGSSASTSSDCIGTRVPKSPSLPSGMLLEAEISVNPEQCIRWLDLGEQHVL